MNYNYSELFLFKGGCNMNESQKSYKQGDSKHKEQEEREAYFKAFEKETDRGLAIASVCYLDDMLEKLIRAVYRKDPRIKMLFKDNQILQSFYNKVCIAYFSGLIPEAVYDDLKLVGEIRNKFAHSILDTVSLDDVSISQKLDKFKQLPSNLKALYPPRLKFILIITHIGALLRGDRKIIEKIGWIKIGGMLNTDATSLQDYILTPQEIEKLKKQVSDEAEDVPSEDN